MHTPHPPLSLPGVKGQIGDREYIACAMPADELCARVQLPYDTQFPAIPTTPTPAEEKRIDQITDHLKQKNRFFGSLTIAVSGPLPIWHCFKKLNGIGAGDKHRIGFLALSGEEKMHVIDGKLRLQALQRHLQWYKTLSDRLSVIFIAHDEHARMGAAKARELFTTLHQPAHPMTKRDTLYLNENDAIAVTTRRLMEDHPHFQLHTKLHPTADDQFPAGETPAGFTTAGALYDCIKTLAPLFLPRHKPAALLSQRLSAPDQNLLHQTAADFFAALQKHIKPLRDYHAQNGKNGKKILRKHRSGTAQDHLIFHPRGLKTLVTLAAARYQAQTPPGPQTPYDPTKMQAIIAAIAKLPLHIDTTAQRPPNFPALAKSLDRQLDAELAKHQPPARYA